MVGDLLWHELEVVKSFYARAMSWAIAEAAAESAKLARIDNPDNETIKATVTTQVIDQIIDAMMKR